MDLGCGDGILTSLIADRLPQGEVVGIDASQGMIAVAVEKERRNLRFVLQDINCLDLAEEFDLVFSNAALHWVKDHHRLLQNIKRALRPEGQLRLNFAADGNCSHFFEVIRETISSDRFAGYFSSFEWPWYMPTLSEYAEIAQLSGLRMIRVWGENADRFFPDVETMVNWVDQPSLVPFLSLVAGKDKNEFRNTVAKRMIEETLRDDGRCFETFRRINIFAER